MNSRRILPVIVIAGWCLLTPALAVYPVAAQGSGTAQGEVIYPSQPDAAMLYMGDMAYLRDELTVPAGVAARIALPPSAMSDSLIVTEGGERVRAYRLATAETGQTTVTWDALQADGPREIALEYLVAGAGWTPRYDLDVLAEDRVRLGFDAEIHNQALDLSDVDVRLVAGMPGAEPGYQPAMTKTQMNVAYNVAQPQAAVSGPVAINHVYDIGPQTLRRGETVRWNLLYADLEARRLIVWDARLGQRTDVIYQVLNSSDVPLAEGMVHAYEGGLYVGQDALEWTPAGGEGSVTIGGLSTLRVRRTESVEDIGTFDDDRYEHTVRLAITNHGGEEIALTVLDEWYQGGQGFTFSHEPRRQGNNVLRWELDIAAGERVEIVYSFVVD